MNITITNQSTVVNAADFANTVSALGIQVQRDFKPVWGVDATLLTASLPPGAWELIFFDNADQAGALGYHDLTSTGLPLGKVFAKTALDSGSSVSVTASHELMEMLVDPDINLTAEVDDTEGVPAKFYAYEVCDAPEDDSYGYQINGVLVSDFVYPAYFESWRPASSTQFDFQNHITQPFQILTNGYLSVLDLGNLSAGWQQINGRLVKAMDRRARVGSRRERRSIPWYRWMKSTAETKLLNNC